MSFEAPLHLDITYRDETRGTVTERHEFDGSSSTQNTVADYIAQAIEDGSEEIRLTRRKTTADTIKNWDRSTVVQLEGDEVTYVCLPGHCENPRPHFHGDDCVRCTRYYSPAHGFTPIGYLSDDGVLPALPHHVMIGAPGSAVPARSSRVWNPPKAKNSGKGLTADSITMDEISSPTLTARDLDGAWSTLTRGEPTTMTLADGSTLRFDEARMAVAKTSLAGQSVTFTMESLDPQVRDLLFGKAT